MLGKTVLVSGGKTDLFFAKKYFAGHSFDTVVCADSGLETAHALHLPVQYFMGDFDSVDGSLLEAYRQGNVESGREAKWVQYPKEKDFVDTQLVLEWILEQGAEEIVILGGTGGRLDHFLANVHLLMLPLAKNIPACLVDERNRIRLTQDRMVLPRESLYGKYISFLPLTSQVTGVTLQGFYYPLQNYTLNIGFPRAVSNELAPGADFGEVTLKKGTLIVIESMD
jgi:thiamine pyrophosphokinase